MVELEIESARIPEIQETIAQIHVEAERELQGAKDIAEQKRIEARVNGMLAALQTDLALEKQSRETKLDAINSRPDKKKAKLNKKEGKLANRILWVVIKQNDHQGGEMVDIEASDGESFEATNESL